MPEQPQWSERTLDMPPQDPWADQPAAPSEPPTTPFGGSPQSPAGQQSTARFGGSPQSPGGHQSTAPFTGSPQSPGGHQSTARFGDAPAGQQAPAGARGTAPFDAQPQSPAAPDQSPFSRGRARVQQRTEQFAAEHEPTGTGWPAEPGRASREPRSLSWHIRRLRRGSEWSNAALIFAFVCWGIWVLSSDGSLVTASIVFVVTVCVAAGVFALSRLVGRLVLERQMGRTRHTARGSHMVAGLFLAGVGFAHLRQTQWVMDAYHWIVGLFS